MSDLDWLIATLIIAALLVVLIARKGGEGDE